MGNSEVGHMTIGSGRVVMQELPRINQTIADNTLVENVKLQNFIAQLKASQGSCHLLGLVSPGGVHAHQNHIVALATIIAQHGITVNLHALLDGRDTPPSSAKTYLSELLQSIEGQQNIKIATICGKIFWHG